MHIHDHLNTRIEDDDELKYLLTTNLETLVLKVQFFEPHSEDAMITSEVRLLEHQVKINNLMLIKYIQRKSHPIWTQTEEKIFFVSTRTAAFYPRECERN